MKKAGLADWRTSNGLPSASDPETESDRTPRGSLLACMTANREPSNQSFEIDREATVCSASRRFLLVGAYVRDGVRAVLRGSRASKFLQCLAQSIGLCSFFTLIKFACLARWRPTFNASAAKISANPR